MDRAPASGHRRITGRHDALIWSGPRPQAAPACREEGDSADHDDVGRCGGQACQWPFSVLLDDAGESCDQGRC